MLTHEHFLRIVAWAEKEIGLTLEENKKYLVEHRLEPIARMYGFKNINALIDQLFTSGDALLKQQIIDSLVTNETYFFRDPESFDDLKIIVQDLYKSKTNKTIRIWSAACSTGQELYSIAISLAEMNIDWSSWKLEFYGTDISSKALEKARNGLYNHFEVQRGLHITQLFRWFKQEGEQWRIYSPYQKNFHWSYLNLLDEKVSVPEMDIIYLRNVLIYFDSETKKKILLNMKQNLTKHGYLILGGTETAFYLSSELERIKPFKTPVYQFKTEENEPVLAKEKVQELLRWIPNEELRTIKWPKL